MALTLVLPSAAARIYLNPGDGHVRYKPHRILTAGSGVACGVWRAKRLRWRHWGRRAARATGTLIYNPGEGGCASSELRSIHARFRFFRARKNCKLYRGSEYVVEKRKVFTRADVFVPSWPEGQRSWHTAPADGFSC